MISIVCNLLQIPDQCDDFLHSIAWYKEIADVVNTDHLIPFVMVVITLAKVICVNIFSPVLAIS